MQIHQIKTKISKKHKKTVGRGGKRGKTSGRGTKGQRARSGHRIRPEVRDMIKKLPKRRGYGRNRALTVNAEKPRPIVLFLGRLEELPANSIVTVRMLVEKMMVPSSAFKRGVKILSSGEISHGLSISGLTISAGAKKKLEASGGKINNT